MEFADLEEIIYKYRENMISALKKLVSYESVEGESRPGSPFGEEVAACLEEALKISEELGLETKNYEGYAGAVEIGEGEDLLGILCHLDVVPAGSDWSYPPFEGVEADGRIYGRGTLDNKGPAVGAIFALKALKELNIELDKRVRVILGTNEESGFAGIEYYRENAEIPELSFSPDAVFPAIHAEKGILIFDLVSEYDNKGNNSSKTCDSSGEIKLVDIDGGEAPNMVPDRCRARLKGDYDYLRQEVESVNERRPEDIRLELNKGDEFFHLIQYGVAAHGSKPQDGKNAVSYLMAFLDTLNSVENNLSRFCSSYNELIGLDYQGKNIGCALKDDVSGNLVFNVGQIKADNNESILTVNIRYPVKETAEKIYGRIENKIADHGLKLVKKEHKEPLFVDKDDPLVETLMRVYNSITGEEAEPIAIGGGTYARSMPKAVAFGPLFPGEAELAHQKDEFIKIESLLKNAAIYACAIAELATDTKLE